MTPRSNRRVIGMSDVRTKRNLVMSIPVIALLLVGPVLRAGAAPCGHTACKDEVALSGLTGGARAGCFKAVISACNAGTCDCGGGANVCGSCGDMIGSLCPGGASGSCPPTTTTTTTTTTTSTTPTTTTTTTTTPTTTTTTTTSTTTTTTSGPLCNCAGGTPTKTVFTTGIGSGTCGHLESDTSSNFFSLTCGGLYFGGAGVGVPLPSRVPDQGSSISNVSCDGTTLTISGTSATEAGGNRCIQGANSKRGASCTINSDCAAPCTTDADC